MEKGNILSVESLSVTLGNDRVIENLNFEIERGDHVTIIGPNGSGKTTLFRALIGMIFFEGSIRWAPDTRIGYVPQKLDLERNVPLTLRDFLESKTGSAGRGELSQHLSFVRLPESFLAKPLGSLSGGEFQRALVAFALLGNTNVLLFDEPTAGIDKPSEEQIYETLHRLQDERGLTIVTISHDLSLVNRFADKVLCLNRRNFCFGIPEEVLTSTTLTNLYGGEHHKFFHHLHNNVH